MGFSRPDRQGNRLLTLADLPQPLVWITVTVLVFAVSDAASRASRRHPCAHPVLTATPLVILLLTISGTPYGTYLAATSPLSLLLGPTTVCLAVPVWNYREVIRAHLGPLLVALFAGAVTAIASAVGTAWVLGAPPLVLASVAPRATTTPVAMALAAQLQGSASLAAVAVLMSGIFGAVAYPILFRRLGWRDARATGLAVGVSAHGIGTARALENNETQGAFAAVGMGTNAILTACILGLLSPWM